MKKIFLTLMAVFVLVLAVPAAVYANSHLSVDFEVNPTVVVGQHETYILTLTNTSGLNITGLSINFRPSVSNLDIVFDRNIDNIAAGTSVTRPVTFDVSRMTATGTHALTLVINFTLEGGVADTIQLPVNLSVTQDPAHVPPSPPPPPLPGGAEGLFVQSGHGTLITGSIGEAPLVLSNMGGETITITGFEHTAAAGIQITPTGSGTSLAPGQSQTVHMHLDGTGLRDTDGGTITVPIRVTFVTAGGRQGHADSHIIIDITPPEPDPTPRPPTTPAPPDARAANMVMVPQRSYISIRPGESQTVNVTFRNSHERNSARDFTVQADMMVGWRNSFTLNRDQLVRAGETSDFPLVINPLPGTSPGVHTVPISFFFFDAQNNRHTGSTTITVHVQETPEHVPNLIIDLFHMDVYEVRPGDSFTLFANVANIGDANALGVEVSVSGFDPRGISLSGADTVILQEIGRSDWDTAGFALRAHEDMAPGTYPVRFTVRYTLANGQSKTFESSYFLTVTGETEPAARGRIVSAGLTANSNSVDAGQNATIRYTVRNTGDGDVTAVRVSLNVPAGLVPTSPNIQILEELAPGETYEFVFTVSPTEDSRTQTYLIGVTTTYETGRRNEDGSRVTESFTQYVGVNVRRADTAAADDDRRAHLTAAIQNPVEHFDVGETGTITLTIRNEGNRAARNVIITALPPEVVIEPTTADIQTIALLPAGESRTLTFDFAPTNEAVTRVYSVRFTIEYENGQTRADGSRATSGFTQIGSIISSAGPRDYIARLTGEIASPVGRFNIGESGTFSLTLTNEGDRTATNVRVEAQPPTVTPSVVVPSSAHVQTIASLAVGESRTLTFDFMPTAEAVTRAYSVRFTIEYENGRTRADGSRITSSSMQYGSINSSVVPVTPEGDRSVPRIILSEYRITSPNEGNPSIVLAGQEFDMYMRVHNTHPTRRVTNIVVSLTMPEAGQAGTGVAAIGNVFSPVSGSNSFFIPDIEPGGEVSVNVRMHCLHNAPGHNYTMRILFEYEDAEGNPFTSSQEVGITVRQPDMFEIVGAINFPTHMSVGQSWDISFFFRNTGFVLLRNFLMVAEGEAFDVSGGIFNVGDFRAGGSEFYEGWVTALEPGEHELKIVVTYDLATGEHVRKEFSQMVTITEGWDFDGMDDFGMGGMGMMGGRGMGGAVRAVPIPGGGMVVMEGGMGMGGGFDMGMMDGFHEPAPEGFIATIAHWGETAFNYMNDNIWIYIVAGAVIALVVTLILVRGAKKRREFSLDS